MRLHSLTTVSTVEMTLHTLFTRICWLGTVGFLCVVYCIHMLHRLDFVAYGLWERVMMKPLMHLPHSQMIRMVMHVGYKDTVTPSSPIKNSHKGSREVCRLGSVLWYPGSKVLWKKLVWSTDTREPGNVLLCRIMRKSLYPSKADWESATAFVKTYQRES